MTTRYRTFADVLAAGRFSDHGGATCRFCKEWSKPVTYYAVRHVVCKDCCEARSGQVLPSVLKAEARARAAVRRLNATEKDVRFIAYLTRASEDYVRSIIAKATEQS